MLTITYLGNPFLPTGNLPMKLVWEKSPMCLPPPLWRKDGVVSDWVNPPAWFNGVIIGCSAEMFHPQWHKLALVLSKVFALRKRDRPLLQFQVLFLSPVPRFRHLRPPGRITLGGMATIVVLRRQVAQGTV